MGMEEHTYLHSEPARKGQKKKKNPGINPGQTAGHGPRYQDLDGETRQLIYKI